jgi:hypothetical protein
MLNHEIGTGFDRFLTWFINAWVVVVAVLVPLGFCGIVLKAPSFWSGLSAVWDHLLDVRFYLTVVLLMSPALAALWWKKRRQRSK